MQTRRKCCEVGLGRIALLTALIGVTPFGSTGFADDATLDESMARIFALDLAPGMAVAIVRDGKPPYLRGFGFTDLETRRNVNAETIYYIASSTKSFTGMAFAILADRGRINLDGALPEYLVDARYHVDVDPAAITMRQLLTHTHGLAGGGPVSFRLAFSGQHTSELLRSLLRFHGPTDTGRGFRYSNIGYNVATMALDQTLDESWKDVLQREIFDPAGMTSTSAYRSHLEENRLAPPYADEPKGFRKLRYVKTDANMQSAGGIMTTARDMARWLEVNIHGGKLGGRKVLPEGAVAEAHRKQADCDLSFGPFQRKGYGLGWYLGPYEGRTLLHHFGGFSGFHAHVSFIPEENVGVVVLTNSSGLGAALAIATAVTAYDEILGMAERDQRLAARIDSTADRAKRRRQRIKADRERRAARPQTLPNPLEAYAGTYTNRLLGEMTLSVVDGHLEATMGPLWSAVEVYDGEKNALRVQLAGGGDVLHFKFREGDARAFSFRQRDRVFRRIE